MSVDVHPSNFNNDKNFGFLLINLIKNGLILMKLIVT
jgi:hypothetical protein